MSEFPEFFWTMIRTSGPWLVLSFAVCGLLYGVLRPERLQKSLGNSKFSSIVKATVSGALLPICSCGVMPLTIGLHRSGAHLGPTLAFLVAAPIINPAALILAFTLLGPEIATVYLISGFVLPVIIGLAANRFGGDLVKSPHAVQEALVKLVSPKPSFTDIIRRLFGGLKWGFADLAVQTSRFILLGTAFAALIFAILPLSFIQGYLASPDVMSLIGVTVLGALMYVCATGHIPFIAALVSVGTAPGIAVTFLLVGVATNLPEMLSIWKLIGRRAVLIYTGIVVAYGVILGYIVNLLFAESFMPRFDMTGTAQGIQLANNFTLIFPEWFRAFAAVAILLLGVYSWIMWGRRKIRGRLTK
ncbi:MAG: permease [Defluviitaleaceae bacterium]|nr:permease [Defluviitaleaceae bacterium]